MRVRACETKQKQNNETIRKRFGIAYELYHAH